MAADESLTSSEAKPTVGKGSLWTGRVLSTLLGLAFIASSAGKFAGGPDLEKGIAPLELPLSMLVPLGILEVTCAVIYLIPRTAVIGAILLTGYMGGAICTHWRVGDPFFIQIGLGVLVWLGLYLREPRLWKLMPLRR